MRIIDISMEVSEDMPVYPGNPSPEIERYRQIPEDSTTESRICIGSHTGTHVDALQHVKEDGETVKQIDLENFYGDCQVLDLTGCDENVERADLEEKEIKTGIVLLKTENSLEGLEKFRKDFTYLTLDAAEYLVDQNVRTVGIDHLSLVKFDGGRKAEEAHLRANERMTVIEGLDLSKAEPGRYVFSGMPLKIAADGAPMRAVLIDREQE
ncbi:cyclase family protein [Candidatus Nanohalococcus occultus]|uniref:Kynurenine formamidase n=1 Tax=Candidatus Nanohalococcus occultus TaxID=2978047 RepID=A0ABY8CEH9_9ARCH|nr:Kynurenine formamidase [Candidatus Nanohaloarchaeota archaeon SVXNc]